MLCLTSQSILTYAIRSFDMTRYCTECNEQDSRIEEHHIIPQILNLRFANEFLGEVRSKYMCRFLCLPCHSKIERQTRRLVVAYRQAFHKAFDESFGAGRTGTVEQERQIAIPLAKELLQDILKLNHLALKLPLDKP